MQTQFHMTKEEVAAIRFRNGVKYAASVTWDYWQSIYRNEVTPVLAANGWILKMVGWNDFAFGAVKDPTDDCELLLSWWAIRDLPPTTDAGRLQALFDKPLPNLPITKPGVIMMLDRDQFIHECTIGPMSARTT